MRLYKFLFWVLTFLLSIWQTANFVLALINRSKSLSTCQEANPSTNQTSTAENKTISIGGYTTTFLGMELGDTYGLADCGQAVQAGLIGIAILLFVGSLFLVNCLACWEKKGYWHDLRNSPSFIQQPSSALTQRNYANEVSDIVSAMQNGMTILMGLQLPIAMTIEMLPSIPLGILTRTRVTNSAKVLKSSRLVRSKKKSTSPNLCNAGSFLKY